jgi:hypothetical protein
MVLTFKRKNRRKKTKRKRMKGIKMKAKKTISLAKQGQFFFCNIP